MTVVALRLKTRSLEVEVAERQDAPGVWTVEAIDVEGDGAIFQAIFAGPEAEARARQYAEWAYN